MKEQDIRKLLAAKLREFRLRAGLTAKGVGEVIGKSEKTVSGWEHGRGQPDADTLFRLCDIYHIQSIAEFYSQEVCQDDFGTLTSDEAELMKYYRSMNNSSKILILSFVKTMAGNPETQEGVTSNQEIS